MSKPMACLTAVARTKPGVGLARTVHSELLRWPVLVSGVPWTDSCRLVVIACESSMPTTSCEGWPKRMVASPKADAGDRDFAWLVLVTSMA